MQDLNDNMDGLFHNAARHYPLKISENEWDIIAGKLASAGVAPARVGTKEKKLKRILFVLLILFTSGTVLTVVLNQQNKIISTKSATGKMSTAEDLNTKAFAEHKNYNHRGILNKIPVVKYTGIETDNLRMSNTTNNTFVRAETKISIGTVDAVENNEGPARVESTEIKTIQPIPEPSSPDIKANLVNDKKVVGKTENGTERKNGIKTHRFYTGIFAGPQFNQVKSQGFSKPGFSAGIITGLNLTKNIAIETGVFVSEKKYFSAGEYFNMKKADPSMPVNMKVISLNGKSTVIEIPLKIKYTFLKRNNKNLFATAGLSSYLLTKESNRYLAVVNGSQQSLTGNYWGNGNYLNAAVNISMGYEFKTKSTTIRLEPYLQVPVKGIGVGSMKVLSTGVHLGFSFPFR